MNDYDAFLSSILKMKRELQVLVDKAKARGDEDQHQRHLQEASETFEEFLELETRYAESQRKLQEVGDRAEELQKWKDEQEQFSRQFLKLAGRLQGLLQDDNRTLN